MQYFLATFCNQHYSPVLLIRACEMKFYNFCVLFGLLALLHAAYSAAQHRAYLRLTEQEFTRLPLDIIIQCLVAMLIVIYGVVHVSGNFKEIRANAELDNRTWEMLSNRQGFYSFSHRGKTLHACRYSTSANG